MVTIDTVVARRRVWRAVNGSVRVRGRSRDLRRGATVRPVDLTRLNRLTGETERQFVLGVDGSSTIADRIVAPSAPVV